MNLQAILRLIPAGKRRRGAAVAMSVLLRAGLDFAGLAAMMPLLAMILDPGEGAALARRLHVPAAVAGGAGFPLAVCCAALAFIVLKNMATVSLGTFQTRYVTSLYSYFSSRLFENYYRRGLLFIKSSNSSDLSHKVNLACYAFAQGVLAPMLSMAGEAALVLLILCALMAWAPVAAIALVACLGPVMWIYSRAVRRRLASYGRAENEARRMQMCVVAETFRGYAEVEINDAFGSMNRRFSEGLAAVSHYRTHTDRILRMPQGVIEICVVGGMVAMVLLSGGGDGTMKVTFGIFAVAALRLLPAARSLINGWAQVRNCAYTADIIAEALAGETGSGEKGDTTSAESSAAGSEQAGRLTFRHELRLDNVTFRYPDSSPVEAPVIDGISMTVLRGERIGIRGASGAGKSTLFNLMLGFYPPTGGRITVDGTELGPHNLNAWHAMTGYVPQEVFILDASLAQNIAFGADPASIDRGRIGEVLRQVRLDGFADSLASGIDTVLGESGCRLSGGQRQRIGIARALYKQAQVLFFDEATSSLDPTTESDVTAAINDVSRRNRELTVIAISHRPSSLEFCDRIIDLDK